MWIDEQAHRVAKAVRRQRKALGMSQRLLAAESGMSDSTVQSLERGQATKYRSRTLAGIERGLRWTPGSVGRIAAGRGPTGANGTATGGATATPAETSTAIQYNTHALPRAGPGRLMVIAGAFRAKVDEIRSSIDDLFANQDNLSARDRDIAVLVLEGIAEGANKFASDIAEFLDELK